VFVADIFDVVYFKVFQNHEEKTEYPDQESGVNDFEK